MRATARFPIIIGQKGDRFWIDDRVRTSLVFSMHVFILRLHNISFGVISHFTIFKSSTAML